MNKVLVDSGVVNLLGEFTILWAFFESITTQGKCRLEDIKLLDFEKLDTSLEKLRPLVDEIKDYFFSKWKPLSEIKIKQYLFFQDSQQEYIDYIYKFLSGETEDFIHGLKSVLFITFRVRNNLFHGNKNIYKIDASKDTITKLNSFLKSLCSVKIQQSRNENKEAYD